MGGTTHAGEPTDGVSRVRTCQVVLISRSFLMTDDSYVAASARIIEGQRAGMVLEPRSDLHDIVPEKTGPTVVRYEIPYWVKDPDLDQIKAFRLVQTVPDNQPCAAGYSGQHVTTVTIPRNSEWRRSHGYAVPRQTSMRR